MAFLLDTINIRSLQPFYLRYGVVTLGFGNEIKNYLFWVLYFIGRALLVFSFFVSLRENSINFYFLNNGVLIII